MAGGYSTSLLDTIRKAIETSKILFMEKQKKQKENNVIDTFQKGKMDTNSINSNGKNSTMEMEANHVLSIKEAFRLATLGGSEGQRSA